MARPTGTDVETLRQEAAACRACQLWERATGTVFGEGPAHARVMLVGEQPGDQEDRAGLPFVGPAGKLLDRALAEVGIDRSTVYVTNAVKHFKWKPQPGGKRRIHDKPNWTEVSACLPWLEAEIAAVRPEVLVLMGATAAQALLGRDARVGALRGRVLDGPDSTRVVVTAHPSSILRARSGGGRDEAFQGLVADLELAAPARASARRND